MKVLEQTSSRLQLQHYPIKSWFTAAMLITSSLAGLVYCLSIAKIAAHLQCYHVPPSSTLCELQQFTAIGGIQTHKMYDLQGAAVIRRSSGKGGPRYHVEVYNGVEAIPILHDTSNSYQTQTGVAEQINQFVSDRNQASLSIDQSARWTKTIYALFSLAILITGIGFSLTPAITCTFYKRINQMVLERQRWHQKSSVIKYPLNELASVILDEKRVKYGKVYRTTLLLNSGKRIPLTQDFMDEKTAHDMAGVIQQFLAQR